MKPNKKKKMFQTSVFLIVGKIKLKFAKEILKFIKEIIIYNCENKYLVLKNIFNEIIKCTIEITVIENLGLEVLSPTPSILK